MSTPNNDGGPAFPCPDTYHPSGQIQYGPTGMSLRDWFAGHQTVDAGDYPSNPEVMATFMGGQCPKREDYQAWAEWHAEFEARVKYIKADAMLKAREEKP